MIIENFDMRFVIGFLIKDTHVLLIRRIKKPWVNKWNGIGGKIQLNESPLQAFIRETQEETGVHLVEEQISYAGIVTWESEIKESFIPGMYAYVAHVAEDQNSWEEERPTKEGLLAWKPIIWATDKKNKGIADNIPYFLPSMYKENKPYRYHCISEQGKMISVAKQEVPLAIT